MQALIGTKVDQTQRFLENGMRIPVTIVDVKDNHVVSHKTQEKNKYQAVQLGFGIRKHATKATLGHAKGAGLEKAPRFLREVKIVDESPLPEVGSQLNPSEVFQPGDIVNVTGISKGKGYAGGVKRYGFHGGPKTHGQSDRHRAPGSIGQGTTPGRVYKGKRMAGRMGQDQVTLKNLKVIDVQDDGMILIKGLVPGVRHGLLYIEKVGEDKKFVSLYKEEVPEEIVEVATPIEEVKAEGQVEVEVKEENSVEEEKAQEVTEAEEVKSEEVVEDSKEEVKEEEQNA